MPDFFRECNTQGLAPKDFEQTFCQRCRNPDCDLAAWGSSKFDQRVATQAERLLNPQQADPRLPKYARIVQADFQSMMREAMMLEIADQRGDWEVPEIDVVDGQVEVASTATTQAVDNAVRGLARSYEQPAPGLPDPDGEFAAQAMAVLGELSEVDPDDVTSLIEPPPDDAGDDVGDVTSFSGDALGESPNDEPPTEDAEPAEAQVLEDAKSGRPIVRPKPPVPAKAPRTANTPMPAGGLMVGGGPAPKPQDPWAPPSGLKATAKMVPVGAKIRMGLGVEEPDE
jgi:hypothetical protein